MGLPRFSTANDDAAVLLRLCALVVLVAALIASTADWLLARVAAFFASAFVGIALQQYAWYTGRCYVECWADEGTIVAAVVTLSAVVLAFISLLLSLLLPGLSRGAVTAVLHVGILTSWRWASWGSLFDVRLRARSHISSTCLSLRPQQCPSPRRPAPSFHRAPCAAGG